MSRLRDDDVIMDGDAQFTCGIGHLVGNLYISLRGGRVTAGVVVQQNHRRRCDFQRAFHHLSGIDGCVVDGTPTLYLVGD